MKIGVIGLGYIGFAHMEALQSIPGVEIAAVCSRRPERLAGDYASVPGGSGAETRHIDLTGAAKYTDAFDLLRDPSLEAVDLCLPTYLHEPVAVAALAAGKHVVVEKPLALSGEEAGRMIAAAHEHGRVLMAAHLLRFMPVYREAARMIREGELGAVRMATFRRRSGAPAWGRWLLDKSKSGGGVFDLLVHDADFCLQAFGAPETVSSIGYEDLGREIDIASATLQYTGMSGVVIEGGWYHPRTFPFSMEFTIVGERGTLNYNSACAPPVFHGADGVARPVQLSGEEPFRAELEYFIGCCERGIEPAACPPAESAAAVRLVRLIDEARLRGGERVPFGKFVE
ncbi:MAG: Gfo/Idh/MocA family oxidoreductase [Bryobacteraceae bacterium]